MIELDFPCLPLSMIYLNASCSPLIFIDCSGFLIYLVVSIFPTANSVDFLAVFWWLANLSFQVASFAQCEWK